MEYEKLIIKYYVYKIFYFSKYENVELFLLM